jgi:chaperone required for assembly of F1-ATPase
MTGPSEPPRRFYKTVRIDGGQDHGVQLDGRGARTPAGLALRVPTPALARLLAQEWEDQGEHILIASMPAVRLAFTAIDRVASAREEVCTEVARYAGADLLCYFADQPKALEERQARAWSPLLDWARDDLELHLIRTIGIVHRTQPAETLLRAARLAGALDDFALAGLAHATALFGSAVLAFAVQRDKLSGEEAFELSRLDEAFQIERWGADEEASVRTEAGRMEARMLEAWFRALDA